MNKVNKLIEAVHKINEEGLGTAAITPTNSTNPPGSVNIAGLPPDSPPVFDLRRKKQRNWNIFFKELVKTQRKKSKG